MPHDRRRKNFERHAAGRRHQYDSPQHRKRRKPIAARRANDLKRKHRQLAREKQDLHRVELWLSGRALGGIINQLQATRVLTDRQADDPHNVELAIAQQLEAQGLSWTR